MSGAGASTVTTWVTLLVNEKHAGLDEIAVDVTASVARVRASVKESFSNRLSTFDRSDIKLFCKSALGTEDKPFEFVVGDVLLATSTVEAAARDALGLPPPKEFPKTLYLLAVVNGAYWGGVVVLGRRMSAYPSPPPLAFPGAPAAAAGATSPKVVASLSDRSSKSLEASASTKFLRFVHEAFPSVHLDTYFDVLTQDRALLTRTSRTFKEAAWVSQFASARRLFYSQMLDAVKPQQSWIDFSSKAAYTSRDFKELQADCLVKIPFLHALEWRVDPAAKRPVWLLTQDGVRTLPAHLAFNRSLHSGPPRDGSSVVSDESTCTSKHYPSGATHYVVGEVYNSHGDSPIKGTQKLLQLERMLCFLCAKEDKAVLDCVAGAMLLGHHFDAPMRDKLYDALSACRVALPCLWSLASAQRLLVFQTPAYHDATIQAFRDNCLLDRRLQAVEAQREKDKAMRSCNCIIA